MPTTQTPFADYQVALMQAQRAQNLANALRQQSFQPVESYDSGVLKAPISYTQGLAKMLQAYAANKGEERAIQNMGQAYGMQGKMLEGMFGGPQAGGSTISSGPPMQMAQNPQTPSPTPEQYGQNITNSALTGQPSANEPQVTQPQMAQLNPQGTPGLRLPPGQTPSSMATMMMFSPQLAGQVIGAYNKPSETGLMASEAGLQPGSQQYNAALYQKLFPPVVNRGYGIMRVDPTTGQLTNDPESLRGVELATGLKTAAETVNKPMMVTNASGAQVPVYPSDVLGVPPAMRGNPPYPQTASRAPGLQNPGIPGASSTPNNNDPWSTIPRIQQPTGIGQSTYQKSQAEHQAQAASEVSQKNAEAANQANQRMAFNNQALDLVDKADTGPGSEFITKLKNVAVSRFNVPESDFQNTPSANIALNKDLVNAALQKGRQLFGSRFTQSEVGVMLTRAAPSAEQTKTAIKFLLQSDNAQLNYQIQKATDVGRYLNSGGDPYQFEGWYAKNFPMTKAVENVHFGTTQESARKSALIRNPDGSFNYVPR